MSDTYSTQFASSGPSARTLGRNLAVYGLAFVFAAIGLMKFTAYEAEAISGLVQSSPLTAWLYGIFSVRGLGTAIGLVEVTAALLLVAGRWSPKAGALGAAMIVGKLVVTLSFLFTAPGWEPSLGGFPFLSVLPGQFLLKDLPLLGIALWALGDALSAIKHTS